SLIFSRQNLPHQQRDEATLTAIQRGGYVLRDCEGTPEAILIATGSEVGLVMVAAEALAREGRNIRVVSMPCVEVFEQQSAEWRDSVLPPAVRTRLAVEAGSTVGWHRYVGMDGAVIGLDRYGESGPGDQLFKHFGFTPERVTQTVREMLK
ncbi:MAG: transketolase, partial [Proteobacteria bacterium]|nr:transketolase [Pseudomonadota bacterium]